MNKLSIARDTKTEMTEETTPADNFAKTLLNDPEKIIEWCREEIKEYEKLIEILSKQLKP